MSSDRPALARAGGGGKGAPHLEHDLGAFGMDGRFWGCAGVRLRASRGGG